MGLNRWGRDMNSGKSVFILRDGGQKSRRLETFHGKPHIHNLEKYIKEDFAGP